MASLCGTNHDTYRKHVEVIIKALSEYSTHLVSPAVMTYKYYAIYLTIIEMLCLII